MVDRTGQRPYTMLMLTVDGHGDVWEMTLPDERYRAVRWAEAFLQRLAAGEYQRVPRAVREEARSILRHYPTNYDLYRAAQAAPDVFCEQMEDLHRFIARGRDPAARDPEGAQPEHKQ